MHKYKVHDIAENNSNRTISELDLCILVTNYWNFSKSKGHNCAENYSIGPKLQIQTQPAYSRDTSVYWISIQNVNL